MTVRSLTFRFRQVPLAAALVLTVGLSSCGGGIEGKYYNSVTGEYALELQGGKVTYAQGMLEGQDLVYEVRGGRGRRLRGGAGSACCRAGKRPARRPARGRPATR